MADHIAQASMLIRRPVAEVFDALVNPDTITKFWLESTTGPLAKGAEVRWRFMVPGATETVTVTAFEDHRRIAFDWSDGNSVNMVFEARGNGATRIAVEVTGFENESAVVNARRRASALSSVISRRSSKVGAPRILSETRPS